MADDTPQSGEDPMEGWVRHLADQYELRLGAFPSVGAWRTAIAERYAQEVGDYSLAVGIMLGKHPSEFGEEEQGLELTIALGLGEQSLAKQKDSGDTYPHMPMEHYEIALRILGFQQVYQEKFRGSMHNNEDFTVWANYGLGMVMVSSTNDDGKSFGDNRLYYELRCAKPLMEIIDEGPFSAQSGYINQLDKLFGTKSLGQQLADADGGVSYIIAHQLWSGLMGYVQGMKRLAEGGPFHLTSSWNHPAEHNLWLANFREECDKPDTWIRGDYFENITQGKIEQIGIEHPEFLRLIGLG